MSASNRENLNILNAATPTGARMMRDLRNDQRSQPSQETSHPSPGSFSDGSVRFTPRPWRIVRISETSFEIAIGRGICSAGGYQQNIANAHLIAAAPDLFEVAASFPGFTGDIRKLVAWNKRRLAVLSAAHPLKEESHG